MSILPLVIHLPSHHVRVSSSQFDNDITQFTLSSFYEYYPRFTEMKKSSMKINFFQQFFTHIVQICPVRA